MKRIRLFISTFLLSIFILSCFGCNCIFDSKSVTFYDYFNTAITIESYSNTISSACKTEINTFLEKCNNQISLTKDSCVKKFNDANKDTIIQFDDIPYALLKRAIQINESITTDYKGTGKFDVAIYPATDLWYLSSEKYKKYVFKVPTQEQIDAVKPLVKIENVKLDDSTKTVTKLNYDGVKIDLGGIAKGYIADELYKIVTKYNIVDGYISIGTSSMVTISVSSLEINHPRKSASTPNTIIAISGDIIKGKSISTSGDYERYYTYNGVRYSHIIDPATCSPYQTGICSATIISDDGTLCDALSTQTCLTDKEALTEWIKTLSSNGIHVIAVYDNGEEKEIYSDLQQNSQVQVKDNTYSFIQVI